MWKLSAVALLLLVACGDDDSPTRPGSAAVHERIESTTDCDKLQDEFDTAMENVERFPAGSPERDVPMAYAEAADERRDELGC